MKVDYKELEGWKRSLDVEIPVEDVNRHFDRLVDDFRRRMAVPGFRKGRAPKDMVMQNLGPSIEEEFLRKVIPDAYEQAMQTVSAVPVSQAQIENLHYKQGEPLRFTAVFEVRPEIHPRDYTGLSLRQEMVEIADEDVDGVLAGLVERAAEYPLVEGEAGPRSIVMVDYEAVDSQGKVIPDGRQKDYPVELGAEGLLPEFERGLAGARAGESRTLTVNYPPEFRNQKLAGQSIRYTMKIKEIRDKKLPTLDDNLARERFGARDLEDLKSRVRLQMEGEERLAARERLEGSLVDEVISRNDFTPPESMVEEILESVVERARSETPKASDEDIARLRDAYRSAAARAVKRQILWDAVARAEKLEVSDADVEAEILRILEAPGAREAGRDEQTLRAPRNLSRIRSALEDRKVFDFLLQGAKVETTTRPRNRRIVTA